MNELYMKKNYLLGLLLVSTLLIQGNLHAQKLRLINQDVFLERNVPANLQAIENDQNELVNNKLYRIIQFTETPNKKGREELQSAGFRLLDYLPDKAYFVEIDQNAQFEVLANYDVFTIAPIERDYKLSNVLLEKKYPEWAMVGTDTIIVYGITFEDLNQEDFAADLTQLGGKVLEQRAEDLFQIEIEISQLEALYDLPYFYFFEPLEAPEEPEGFKDVANHRSHLLNNQGTGLPYTGAGITVMMQDDGPIGPHIDYQGRIETYTSSNFGDHGDHCAGIIMGSGNLDPDGIGNAPGARLLVYSSNDGNYSAIPNLYDTAEVVITSKSYGNGQNAGYTSLTRFLDDQCDDYPSLVHVFSAGNSGTSNFGYGAGAGWGNITGGHKQGKNVLAVGNLSATDVLAASSSRGPSTDGRIKPDICAVGTAVISTIDVNTYDSKTGTSMACPAVAGSLALLYEAYRDMHDGAYPNAALMNASILNTADDLGNPGPDFKYGWGRINTMRAYELIAANNYQDGIVEQGLNSNHTIVVPEGTKELRVMVYWTDYRGAPNANPALVNDLNIVLTGPDNVTYEPWVLNPAPNAGILNQDAERGVDDLNNVEQVTIENPLVGGYTLNVDGFNVPQGPQEYFVVYEFVKEEVEVIYPAGGEGLVPGQSETIRWDAFGETGSFTIDYSLDGGQTWININDNLPASWRSYPWIVPNVVSDEAKIRITRDGQSDESKANFTIIGRPDDIQVEWACPNSFNISWDTIPGASGYQVYLLGEKFMDSVGYSATDNATIYANSNQTQWVSVAAVGANGGLGKRAIAIQKSPGTFGCNLVEPVGAFTSICQKVGSGSCIQFQDISTNAGQGAAWEWSFPGGTPATSNAENPVVCYEEEGFYDVTLTVKNGVGENTVSYSQFIEIKDGEALPFMENFESGQIPTSWKMTNENTLTAWIMRPGTSAYEQGGQSITVNNLDEGNIGGINRFETQQIDLTSSTFSKVLTFDLAYASGISATDTLSVYATNDCGYSQELLFKTGGEELSTALAQNELFIPTKNDWIRKVLSLANFTDKTSVSFIFENESGNGNAIYVDNLNVALSNNDFPNDAITAFPNPFQNEVQIAGALAGEATSIRISDSRGKIVYESEFTASGEVIQLNLGFLSDGMYVISVQSNDKTLSTKFVKDKGY